MPADVTAEEPFFGRKKRPFGVTTDILGPVEMARWPLAARNGGFERRLPAVRIAGAFYVG